MWRLGVGARFPPVGPESSRSWHALPLCSGGAVRSEWGNWGRASPSINWPFASLSSAHSSCNRGVLGLVFFGRIQWLDPARWRRRPGGLSHKLEELSLRAYVLKLWFLQFRLAMLRLPGRHGGGTEEKYSYILLMCPRASWEDSGRARRHACVLWSSQAKAI